jgi:PBSX family phage portal protein
MAFYQKAKIARITEARRERRVNDLMAATFIPFAKSESENGSGSVQIPDKFEGTYEQYDLIAYESGKEPAATRMAVENSNIIPQCVDAYKTNVTKFGATLEYITGESDNTAADEWERAQELLDTVVLEQTLESFLSELVDDLEDCGIAYVEVSRGGGLPALYRMAPEDVRCTRKYKRVKIEYKRWFKGKEKTYYQEKWIRRYAQKVGNDIVWFREFGVKPEVDPQAENEIICLRIDNDGPYSKPRWFGNAPGVIGSHKAEVLNHNYFANGRMLSLLLTVINGELTDESIQTLKNTKGTDSQGGILLLEAIGYEKGMGASEEKEKVQIKLDKLNDLLQNDALFLEYNRDKRKEILSAFRLPPIYVGQSDDYNLATSNTARRITEEQVFIPYRKWLMDEIFNNRLFPEMGIHRVKAVLRGPKIVDPDERKQLLDFLADRGIMLVRHLIPIAEEVLGTTIDESKYTDEYLDTPIAQLVNTTPTEMVSDTETPEDKIVAIAKQMLRKAEKKVVHHV